MSLEKKIGSFGRLFAGHTRDAKRKGARRAIAVAAILAVSVAASFVVAGTTNAGGADVIASLKSILAIGDTGLGPDTDDKDVPTTSEALGPVQYFQGFEVNNDWVSPGSGTNPTRVPSGTNGVPSKTGGFHAEVVAGNFTRLGGFSSVFPANGFTTSTSIYLNMTGGYANDTRFDWSAAISNTLGAHRRDFVFNCGFYNDAGPYGSGARFVCSASNNSSGWPRNPSNAPVTVTTTGWYTMRHIFSKNLSNVLVVKMDLVDPSGNVVGTWTRSDASDIIGVTVGGNRYGWMVTSGFPFLAMDDTERVSISPEVINASLGDPFLNPNIWVVYNDETNTINNSLGSMVVGPGTPPIGNGSFQTSVTGTQRRNLATFQFSGTPLADINTFAYSTYNPSAGNGGSPNRSGFLYFNVDFDGSDTWQRRLVYVPNVNGTVLQDTWQEWDAISGGNALWFYSGPTWPMGIGGGGEPGTSTKTWNQILSQYPGVRIRVTDSNVGIRVGEPYADGYTENIDAFKFGTSSFIKHFNFDPLPLTTYVDDSWVSVTPGTDPDGAGGPATNFGYDAFATIQGGINGVQAGGTVYVYGGTYSESVHVNKPGLSIYGAGAGVSVIVGPHNTGGPDTLLIDQNNTLVDGFTVTRSGNTVGTWLTNVKNQGVRISAPGSGSTLQNCLITGNRNGIYVGQSSNNNIIRRNVIDFNRTGIHLVDHSGTLIEENYITNNWTMGFLYRTEGGPLPSGIVARNNRITGNWYSEVEFREPSGGADMNFSGNYIGTSVTRSTSPSGEPGYSSQIPTAYGGTSTAPGTKPTIAGPESARVDYSPYLLNGGDVQPGTYGFQGDFSAVRVTPDAAHIAPPVSRIQEGIDLINAAGNLVIDPGVYPGNVNVNKALAVKGNFTVGGTFTVSSPGASVSPGLSPGIINTGDFTLTSGSTLDIEINGNVAGVLHDQVNVTGAVNLGGASLNPTLGYVPAAGHSYTIVNNDGMDPVTGIFAGLPEGAIFFMGSYSFQISYVGGTGNDVVITAIVNCNNVSIPTTYQVQNGDTVTVDVNVDDTTGNGLISTDFTLTYDPSVVTYNSFSLGTVTAASGFSVNASTPGVIVVSIFRATPWSGAGSLASITFNAVGLPGSSSAVAFTSFVFNEGTPCLTTSNGLVTIIGGTITGNVTYGNTLGPPSPRYIDNVTITGAGSPTVSATTDTAGNYSLSGFGPGSYTRSASKTGGIPSGTLSAYDASLISQHVVSLITLNPTQQTVADVSGNSVITSFDAALIARYTVLLPGSGSTGNWVFTPASYGPSTVYTNITGENYVGLLMGDVSGNWNQGMALPGGLLPMPGSRQDESRPPMVKAPVVTTTPDSVIEVPVTIRGVANRGAVAYNFELAYDPNVVRPLENPVTVDDTVSGGLTVVSNAEGGVLRVAAFGVAPIDRDGVLIKLRFRAVGTPGSSTNLSWDKVFLNEDVNGATGVDGTIRIKSPHADEVETELSGRVMTATGERIAKAAVTVTDLRGNSIVVYTDRAGVFRIPNVEYGQTYNVTVANTRYTFLPITISISDRALGLDIVAEP
jgi:parallel beta-helix repeat protein